MERLTIYDFHKIMHDVDSLIITNFHIDIYQTREAENKVAYFFDWEWNGYSGYGEIFTINGDIDYDSVYCRDSHLTVHTNSKKQAQKHVSELYNEKELLELFEYILRENNI